MHSVVSKKLEEYLSGVLQEGERGRVEAHLAECSGCRSEWDEMVQMADQVRLLRVPEQGEAEPRAGFYARVVDRIEREREVPFWSLLLEPSFGRRWVFACLMLLALVGAYVGIVGSSDYPSRHQPEAILAGRPAPPVPSTRLGRDINRNREVILASLVAGD